MARPTPDGTYVALLRGINVGGRNVLPMRALAAMFTDAGARDVRTYIQSGNVVFRAASQSASRIPTVVSQRIAAEFTLDVPVIVRTADELRAAAHANPFVARGVDERELHVMFLAEAPSRAKVASLDPSRSPGDAFVVRGRDVFLHLPNGAARTKLTTSFFDRLGGPSTGRNWRTVLKLLEMASE